MQQRERTPSSARDRYPYELPEASGGFRKTLATQVLICILLFMFCSFIKLSPETDFINIKSAVRSIVWTNTDPALEWQKLVAFFSKEKALETLTPVSGMTAPSSGKIVKGFGMQDAEKSDFHYGAEISCDKQENIVAANDGTVTEIATNAEYGSFIVIQHSEEISTLYGHLNEILPSVGDKVTKSQPIARAGGENSTFYFELRRGDTYLDPAQFIAFEESAND